MYSILFLHHLKLGRYDLAFINMDKNPERSRRIDCLRELVITLMNSKHVDKLLNFPYNDLLPHLENIMEQRARSLQSHQAAPYYNFLYALHVRMENFRKGMIFQIRSLITYLFHFSKLYSLQPRG